MALKFVENHLYRYSRVLPVCIAARAPSRWPSTTCAPHKQRAFCVKAKKKPTLQTPTHTLYPCRFMYIFFLSFLCFPRTVVSVTNADLIFRWRPNELIVSCESGVAETAVLPRAWFIALRGSPSTTRTHRVV